MRSVLCPVKHRLAILLAEAGLLEEALTYATEVRRITHYCEESMARMLEERNEKSLGHGISSRSRSPSKRNRTGRIFGKAFIKKLRF